MPRTNPASRRRSIARRPKAAETAAPPPPRPVDDENTVLTWRDALLVIPYSEEAGSASARTYAVTFARKLKRTVEVRSKHRPNTVVLTIDAAYLASLNPSRPARAAARPLRTEPTGMRALIVAKAMREEGASSAELLQLTGWKAGPWKSVIGTIANRYGYRLHITKVEDEVRYFLRLAA